MNGLVLGASGFLGKKIFQVLKDHHDLTGTCNAKQDQRLVPLDVSNKEQLLGFLERGDFDFIIDTIAIADPEECLKDKEKTQLVNVEHVSWICNHLTNKKTKLIYISTDFVFDGSSPPYNEDSKPNPINFYGETKLAAEKAVLENPNNIVLRLHVLYGYNDKADKPDFFRKAYEPLNAEKTTKLDDIRKRYPTFIDDVPPAINLLLSHDSNGIYHLCNKEALTHYQFGLKVAKEFQLRAELLERGRIEDKKICERPLDNHLDCTKIERLGFKASTVDEALKKIHKQMQK